MLADATYRQWTNEFNPGSYYKGDWSEGSKILFLGPNPNGSGGNGMLGRIKENRTHEFISIEYLGLVEDGREDTESAEAKKWAPAFENYTFRDKDGGTELQVDMDSNEDYKAMFEDMWPKALQELKKLTENN